MAPRRYCEVRSLSRGFFRFCLLSATPPNVSHSSCRGEPRVRPPRLCRGEPRVRPPRPKVNPDKIGEMRKLITCSTLEQFYLKQFFPPSAILHSRYTSRSRH